MQQDLRGNRTGHLFSIISSKMAALGFSRTPEQCQTRLKRLKSSFRQCYQNKYTHLHREGWKGICVMFSVIFKCAFLLLIFSSLKGHEQVQCKFYNELGRILVKDFQSVMQLDDMSMKDDDGDFPSFSHHNIGKRFIIIFNKHAEEALLCPIWPAIFIY